MNWLETHSYVAAWISTVAAVAALFVAIAQLRQSGRPAKKPAHGRISAYLFVVFEVLVACSSLIPVWARLMAGIVAAFSAVLILLGERQRRQVRNEQESEIKG